MATPDFVRPTLIHKQRWAQLYNAFDQASYRTSVGCQVTTIEHPKHGTLTGVKTGHCWMVFAGDYVDAVSDSRLPQMALSGTVLD